MDAPPRRDYQILLLADRKWICCPQISTCVLMGRGEEDCACRKTQGGARTAFTDEQIAEFKAKLLELIPQGKTLRQILAEPGMCSMTYLFRELLPNDKEFSEQYARASLWLPSGIGTLGLFQEVV